MIRSYDCIFFLLYVCVLYGIRMELEACDNLWMFAAFLLLLN